MNFSSIQEFIRTVPDESACIQYLEEIRWAGNVVSPFDETSKVYKCKNGYKCKNSGKYFNVKVGTIFEDTKLPLTKWFMALYLFATHKKGISSYQLATDIGVTQKSAWFMLHRLRYMFNHPDFKKTMSGTVEVDETYIGGQHRNKHKAKRAELNKKGTGSINKTPVVAMLERNGNVNTHVLVIANGETIKPLVLSHIEKGSELITDGHGAYVGLHADYKHEIINHSSDEWKRGNLHTNTIEGFFNYLKNTIRGTYHFTSIKHLAAYTNEVAMRYNTRKISVNSRFDFVLTNMENRLTYKLLIS